MEATTTLSKTVGVRDACAALGFPRATFYRHAHPRPCCEAQPRPRPPLALDPQERQAVLDVLHSPRFADASPRQIWATLLDDEQQHLCSVRTMYRILETEGELRERRNQLRHPAYKKPELVATAPNQVWTWDITKLKGPVKWTYFYLYVILDLYSRLAVGWMVAQRESAALAQRLIAETASQQGLVQDQLTLHADRGSSMTAKSLALMLADLGLAQSHSRPYTSNDNPFSEAHFKTLKYHPSFPERFGSLEDARSFAAAFFTWYNTQHRHSSLALLPPADVHYGRAAQIIQQREAVLRAAFEANPKRFKGRVPSPGTLPEAVWINPPEPKP
jgi:putative transposase